MTNKKFLYLLLTIQLLYSFKENTVCDLVNSNLGYAIKQATKAENSTTLNKVKYYTYIAVNTLQKLDKQIDECGCNDAEITITKGLTLLKNVTKTESISSAKSILGQAKRSINISINSIAKYSLKNKNIIKSNHPNKIYIRQLHSKVDSILIPFEKSIQTVLESDNCREAYKLMVGILDKTEYKLLNGTLTEAKRYYYLRTKKITEDALSQLENCTKDNQ